MSKKTTFRNTRDGLQEISTKLHEEFWSLVREFNEPQSRHDWHLDQAEKLAELTTLIRKIDGAHQALWNDFTPEGETND